MDAGQHNLLNRVSDLLNTLLWHDVLCMPVWSFCIQTNNAQNAYLVWRADTRRHGAFIKPLHISDHHLPINIIIHVFTFFAGVACVGCTLCLCIVEGRRSFIGDIGANFFGNIALC